MLLYIYEMSKQSPNFFQVYGLDINPRAVKISWINLYLNALDDNGQPIYDGENKTLLDRVEFHESDLLAYCRDRGIELERIVGCIPQVLSQIITFVMIISYYLCFFFKYHDKFYKLFHNII